MNQVSSQLSKQVVINKLAEAPLQNLCNSETFQKHLHQPLDNLNGITCVVNNIFDSEDDLEQALTDHEANLRSLLQWY